MLGIGTGLAAGSGVASANTGGPNAGPSSSTVNDAHHATGASKRRVAPAAPAMPASRRTRAAAAVPGVRLPQIPSPGVAVQQVLNSMVPIINNTPVRGVLDRIDPAGVSAVRLLGAPASTAMSPDGTRLYVVTDPVTSTLPFLSFLLPSSSSVTEIDTRTNTVVGVPIAFSGSPTRPIVVSPDGTRAYLTAAVGNTHTQVTTVNTSNSTALRTVTLAGAPVQGVLATPDGTRVFQETMNASSDMLTVNLIDGNSGYRIGKPLQINGFPIGGLTVNPDGSRAYETTILTVGNGRSTAVTAINATDNTLAGYTVFDDTIPDGGVVVSPDGAHAVQITHPVTGAWSTVATLDPATAAAVGIPVTLDGFAQVYPAAMYTRDGKRLAVVTSGKVTVFDTADGTVVGSPVTVPGGTSQAAVFGMAGDRVYFLSHSDETRATVVDISNSTVVGTPVTLDGVQSGTDRVVASPDGSLVAQTLDPGAVPPGQPYFSIIAMIGTDGALVGAPASVVGWVGRHAVFSPDGTRAYVLGESAQSVVSAIDTSTGAVIGAPVTVSGTLGNTVYVAANGERVYVTTEISIFDQILPIPLPFPIEYWLSITHVNAIDVSTF